jgi:hypothetical protein
MIFWIIEDFWGIFRIFGKISGIFEFFWCCGKIAEFGQPGSTEIIGILRNFKIFRIFGLLRILTE